jgi:hypothetical protein
MKGVGRKANQSNCSVLSCSTDENAGSGGLFLKVLPTMEVTGRTTISFILQGEVGEMVPLEVMPPPLFSFK